jgi:molybdate transport system substrate-binding protein
MHISASARRWALSLCAVVFCGILVPAARAADPPKPELLIFAAASLTNVLQEIGASYTQETQQPVKFSFAASSTLARQMEAGARVDAFFSADTEWMDYLQQRTLIDTRTRRDIVGNRLVLVAPVRSRIALKIEPQFPLAKALGNARLATGDPDTVPVGRYARAALTSLGVWNEVADRIVRADNVRSALAFVARGETPLGIVYETDAKVEKQVRVVDVFPSTSHPPITYPVAVAVNARPGAAQFVEYLSGATAQAIFAKYGFQRPASAGGS